MKAGGGRLVVVVALVSLAAGCGDEPTSPALDELEVVFTGGDGGFAVVGQELRLEAQVRGRADGLPRSGVAVRWSVESGDAQVLPGPGEVSDQGGTVFTRVRMGDTPGPVGVRVVVQRQTSANALASATVGAHPRLDGLSSAQAVPGAELRLLGAGFSPVAEDNVVLFSGIRARVRTAAADRLDVVVPPCLPAREVGVTVQLGELVSEPRELGVETAGTEELELAPGDWIDVDEPAEPRCLRLPAGGRYLVLGASSSTVAGGRWATTLRGLASEAPSAGVRGPLRPRASADPAAGRGALLWEAGLRLREEALLRAADPGPVPAPPAPVPSVGDRRSFRVFNVDRELEEVTAVARYVGARAAVFVDEAAPEGGFADADLAELAERFDVHIHPTVTGVFGPESDLDGNDRVIILLTPVVNRLSPLGSDGFVGGFFFGLDLLVGEGGNDGEVFYALVPDPDGLHGDPRSRERILEVLPAVLAHEFQHMVHFNQRALLLGGNSTGALWLSEGLAQMAEELVARRHEAEGDSVEAELFRGGNRVRARRYLEDPAGVSLIVSAGQGTLPERGAGWLFTLYLADRWGEDILRALSATTRTGVANVTGATGAAWPRLLADWWSALALDDPEEPVGYAFGFPSVDLRALLAPQGGPWPLEPERPGPFDFDQVDTLWSASARHYIVETEAGGPLVLRLAGPTGAAAPSGSDLRLRVVRLF